MHKATTIVEIDYSSVLAYIHGDLVRHFLSQLSKLKDDSWAPLLLVELGHKHPVLEVPLPLLEGIDFAVSGIPSRRDLRVGREHVRGKPSIVVGRGDIPALGSELTSKGWSLLSHLGVRAGREQVEGTVPTCSATSKTGGK